MVRRAGANPKKEKSYDISGHSAQRSTIRLVARMQTSIRTLDRLLDPKNTSVTLHTLQRAAVAVGQQLRLELV
jgi:hypothetical protein